MDTFHTPLIPPPHHLKLWNDVKPPPPVAICGKFWQMSATFGKCWFWHLLGVWLCERVKVCENVKEWKCDSLKVCENVKKKWTVKWRSILGDFDNVRIFIISIIWIGNYFTERRFKPPSLLPRVVGVLFIDLFKCKHWSIPGHWPPSALLIILVLFSRVML